MNKTLKIIAVSALLSACGSSELDGSNMNSTDSATGSINAGTTTSDSNSTTNAGSTEGNTDAGTSGEPTVEAALPEPVDTNTLQVDRDFNFATARSIDVEFNISDAADDDASVSICTEYASSGDFYDINFDSCTVNGALDDGVFQHSMDVTIDKESVVAVVLFQNPSKPPMFKEFFVDTTTRVKGDGSNKRVIVWNE